MDPTVLAADAVTFPARVLDDLVALLREDGYRVVGPTVRDGAVVHGELHGVADLPAGVGDEQGPGHYRLTTDGAGWFGFAVGPSSPRRELLPPRHALWEARLDSDGVVEVVDAPLPDRPVAFLGLRACDLAAIAIQDRVLLGGAAEDRVYASARQDALVVAVECATPAATCFCTSMGGGPEVQAGADLVLTELLDGEHRFLAQAETDVGRDLLARLPDTVLAHHADGEQRAAVLQGARDRITRNLDADGVHDLLLGNLEHPRWDEVAERCLACGSCTLVCPTCFCTEVEDTTDLTGAVARHDRRWASCFELSYSHAGPGSVRSSTRARYRQWLTHKLATWVDQFDSSGCVGCGRCITWCPVGIDITEEVAAIGTP